MVVKEVVVSKVAELGHEDHRLLWSQECNKNLLEVEAEAASKEEAVVVINSKIEIKSLQTTFLRKESKRETSSNRAPLGFLN